MKIALAYFYPFSAHQLQKRLFRYFFQIELLESLNKNRKMTKPLSREHRGQSNEHRHETDKGDYTTLRLKLLNNISSTDKL